MVPFVHSHGMKYVLVFVDYVSKWVEALTLPTMNGRVSLNSWRRICYPNSIQLGALLAMVDQNFVIKCSKDFLKNMVFVTIRLFLPPTDLWASWCVLSRGQTDFGKNWLKGLVKEARWCSLGVSYCLKDPIGMSPYQHVYEKTFHLPVKLEHKVMWALKRLNFWKEGSIRTEDKLVECA